MSAYDDALKAGGVPVTETPYEAALRQGGVPVEEPGLLTRAGRALTSIPFSGIEGAPSGEETPAPFREAIDAAARSSVGQPFVKQAYTVAGSFLKGGGTLTKGVTDVGEYVGKPLGIPRSDIFDKAAQMWLDKGEELHQLAQEKGADFVDKMVGSAVGGGVPGVAEFMLNVPYYSFKGAIEAQKRGDSQAWGAITGGAKRYVLGETLHAAGTLTKPLAIPATGAVMGVQTAAEGGTPEETAEAVGTGFIFGAAGAPGRVGPREAGRTIREGIDLLIRSKKPITVETPSPEATRPPVEPPGSTAPPEAAPTPPKEPIVTPAPSAAPGTPEFYKAEADRLGVEFRGMTPTGLPSRPWYIVFQDGDNKTGAGSFTLNPGESVEQALTRARARYEAQKPAEPVPPVPPVSEPEAKPLVPQRAEERPVRSGYPESQVPDLPTEGTKPSPEQISELLRQRSNAEYYKKSNPTAEDYYKPGNVIYGRYWNSLDVVLDYKKTGDNRFEVKVVEVDSKGNPLGEARTHATRPDKGDYVIGNLNDLKERGYFGGSPNKPEPRKLSTGLSTEIPQTETPGDKFEKVRKEKIKAKKEAAEPTLQPPPATPPEGGLFGGKGEEGFAPEKDFRTKPAEPIDEGAPMSRSAIAKFLSEKFDIPLRVGRFKNALGIFKVGPEVIRTRFAHDIEVISHEIGHALHKYLWPDARTSGGGLAAGPLRAFQDELIPIATKPRAGGSKNAEGFAEFIRKYVVNPDEAKRVAPKFFAFFEKELDAKSPDSKAILLKARADYKRWLEQPALARVMGSINQKPSAAAAVSFKKLYENVIDALYPLEEITKEMAKVKNIDQVPANLNPYKLAHLLAGWKGKADAWLEYKPYSFKTYRFSESVKSFRKIMEPIKKHRDIFDAYLVSRRSVQLGETKTGILDADARKVIEDMERDHPEFKQASIELKHYQNALLRYLYDGGIINGEQFLRMRQANEDYVPFYRVMDYERVGGSTGGGSHEVKGAPVYRFKGSWRDIVSPTESIIKNTYAFINAAEKNAVGKAIVALSRQGEGLGKFVEKIPADTQRIAVKDTELEDMLRKYGKWTETTQFQTTEKVIRESIKDETGADIPAGDRGTRIMKERAVEALKTRGYSEAEANTIVARIASAKDETARSRIIERVTERATVRNTVREFGIEIPEGLAYIYRKSPNTPKGNVITVMERGKPTYYEVDERIYNAFHALDKEGANTLIRILSIPSRLLRVGATLTPEFSLGKNPIRDQWTAFINSKYGYKPGVDLARGLFTAAKKNEDYWRWKVGGGEHSAMVSMDREYFDKTWTEIMRDRGVKAEALHIAQHPIDVLRTISEFSEEGTRLGEFRRGLKKEKSPEGPPGKVAIQDAAYASREVTLPFARMGAKTKAVNMIIAFWNANVQDLDKIHRQFKEYPLQTSIRTMASITLPSVLLAIANHGNKKIDEIAQWQKDIFWLVDVGPFVLRIPKPFIMGIAFGSFPERIVNYILDKDPHAFDGLLESLSRGSMPGWMPTFANPVIENWANKSRFTDRQIVPKAREDLSPQHQYAPYTTETAKKIGGFLAKIPGMKGSDLENLVVSPAKIENLIRGYTGGLGMWALNAANASLKTVGIVPARVEPSKQLSDYPLIKAFVVRYPTADTESIQRFFDDYKEAETNLKTSKFLFKKFEPKPAMEILSREDVARLVSIKTALTNAHKIVDAVYENPKMTPEEKRRIIDQTYMNMTAMARAGNKVLDKFRDSKKAAEK